jgi:Flp pilus assembly secretin CpaC
MWRYLSVTSAEKSLSLSMQNKFLFHHIPIFLICLFLLSKSQACDVFGEFPEKNPLKKSDANVPIHQIQIYTEIIEITALEYAEIMTESNHSMNHTALRNLLIEQVKKDKAKLLYKPASIARSGEKGSTESIREFIYETEYVPPENIPNEQVAPTDPPSKSNAIIFPPTPTAFETRNLGSTLYAEPIIEEDGKTITLRFEPEMVKHLGYNVSAEWNTVLAKTNVQVPIFSTLRIIATLSVIDGQFTLVGTHSRKIDDKVDESKRLLVFVKASLLKLEK